MKDRLIRVIKSVIRLLKLVLRVLIGVLHAITGKRCHGKCECEKSDTDKASE